MIKYLLLLSMILLNFLSENSFSITNDQYDKLIGKSPLFKQTEEELNKTYHNALSRMANDEQRLTLIDKQRKWLRTERDNDAKKFMAENGLSQVNAYIKASKKRIDFLNNYVHDKTNYPTVFVTGKIDTYYIKEAEASIGIQGTKIITNGNISVDLGILSITDQSVMECIRDSVKNGTIVNLEFKKYNDQTVISDSVKCEPVKENSKYKTDKENDSSNANSDFLNTRQYSSASPQTIELAPYFIDGYRYGMSKNEVLELSSGINSCNGKRPQDLCDNVEINNISMRLRFAFNKYDKLDSIELIMPDNDEYGKNVIALLGAFEYTPVLAEDDKTKIDAVTMLKNKENIGEKFGRLLAKHSGNLAMMCVKTSTLNSMASLKGVTLRDIKDLLSLLPADIPTLIIVIEDKSVMLRFIWPGSGKFM